MQRKLVLLMASLLLIAVLSVPPALAAPAADTPTDAQVAAIENVIQKANQEQVQAVATGDPTVMQDTSTTDYYQQSAQVLNGLLSSGVTSIQLAGLQWGPITLQDATTAQATTTETWNTTLSDGSTHQDIETNIYTLVFQNGAWKVQDDQHPDQGMQTI